MKLLVYKGFSSSFLNSVPGTPLLSGSINEKKDIFAFDRKTRRQLEKALLSLEDGDTVWASYEEYSLIRKRVDEAIEEDDLELIIYRNNLFPDYYPLEFSLSDETAEKIINVLEGNNQGPNIDDECNKYINIYNSLIKADGTYYGGFNNYEYDKSNGLVIKDYYPHSSQVEDSQDVPDFKIFLNDDIETYLRDLARIKKSTPNIIGVSYSTGAAAQRMLRSLQTYCFENKIRIVNYYEAIPEDRKLESELISIAKNDIKISNFTDFRNIKFYKNPDIDKEIIDLSQSQIIQEIIHQAEAAYDVSTGQSFRDIFITASTGAGKSVMFQIPAVYLAQKYHKLTIIIEPVKALMQDQKEKLQNAGYTRVDAFNSDLITQVEKEAVLQRIKNNEVDLLYLSPETLLSYSIETIIGDRDIGLIIIDEAHIVTTWGVGFRPDYWYLGGYLNRLRNQIQTTKGKHRRVYRFPICAFTATAINGGIDDSVSDTIISLYMENPVKYLGYVRREDIKFDISIHEDDKKLSKSEYEEQKCQAFDNRLKQWLANNEKTIVYFPFASLARDASKGFRGFAGITVDKRIGTYTGRNINEQSNEAFNETKKMTFDSFRDGTKPIVYATKAFGMGVDVNDVKNVYHYAASGNLSDYVQEIGRAARAESLVGTASTDFFYDDMRYMRVLFGMSQIRQYQIKKVLEGIYETYKGKKEARSFLISPESFTYIFKGKEDSCINQLKTCLLMLEKDFYDKYNFKVLISRPQSVFTKAFICINREHEQEVLSSIYGQYMGFIMRGRLNETQSDGSIISDTGDIYTLDLKSIWEDHYPNLSFPQFKYWFFNGTASSDNDVKIMPSIREYIAPRQRIAIESHGEHNLSEIRELILADFEFIADALYSEFRRQYFTLEDFIKLITDKYGKTKARIIGNSLFDLVDPSNKCVKSRTNDSGRTTYSISNGNLKELMRRPIIRSNIMRNIISIQELSYTGFISLSSDNASNTALKLMSIFDYITYEVSGGKEPEIFIRLNDPSKIRSIVIGNTPYTNSYISKAKRKHDRDKAILLKFFKDLNDDKERWDYIEDYFLGYDVLDDTKNIE